MRHLDQVSHIAYSQLDGNKAEADEVVQQTFLEVFANLDRFDVTRDFGAWLRTVARRRVLDRKRSQAQDATRLIELTDTIAAPDPIPATVEMLTFEESIAGLDAERAEILRLRVQEGLTFAEIGKRMGLPRSTVADRFREAQRHVAASLEVDDA